MPWMPDDAMKHTHAADTPAKRRQWAEVANAVLAKHDDEAKAIRIANDMVGHAGGKKNRRAARGKPTRR